MHFYGTMEINDKGHLAIGGVDTIDLANKYGTPLYVYDIALVRERAQAFRSMFEKYGITAQVAYASKAFSSIAIFQIIEEEGLSLDVVSSGELLTAIKAGFPVEKIHLHGNNKSKEELEMAIEYGIGCIVVDNFHEIDLIESICKEKNKQTSILFRVTPGISAATHDFIATGQEDSKFGFDLQSGQVDAAYKRVEGVEQIHLLGLHSHIGSQIFETKGFILAARKIMEVLAKWKETYAFEPEVLNLGGGFGIRYTEEDKPLPPEQYVEAIILEVKKLVEQYELNMPEIWIEPGRSLVGEAGTTLYTIGSQKDIPNIRKYIAVDGGMSDNLRPALYDAKYEAVLARAPEKASEETVSIAGKCCESGDMLIWDLPLPAAKTDDILAVFATGAYGYSMANNYNRIPRAAVVFVEDGKDFLAIERETIEDVVRLDRSLR